MNSNAVGVGGDAGDTGDQPQEQAPVPMQPVVIIPDLDEQAEPANDNGQIQHNVGGGQAGALNVNPHLPMLDLDVEDEVVPPIPPIIVPREQIDREFSNACDMLDMVELGAVNAPAPDMPVIEVAQDEAPVAAPAERPRVAAPLGRRRVAAPVSPPETADDVSNDSIDEELSSMSSATSSTTTETSTTETSDEDKIPMIPFYNSGPGNGPTVPMIYVPGRYPPGVQPVEPVARREVPQPSSPVLIPPPTRSRPTDDDDSSSPEPAPTRSKRRRPERPH